MATKPPTRLIIINDHLTGANDTINVIDVIIPATPTLRFGSTFVCHGCDPAKYPQHSWGFPWSWAYPTMDDFCLEKNPKIKWMVTGGTPTCGNPHVPELKELVTLTHPMPEWLGFRTKELFLRKGFAPSGNKNVSLIGAGNLRASGSLIWRHAVPQICNFSDLFPSGMWFRK